MRARRVGLPQCPHTDPDRGPCILSAGHTGDQPGPAGTTIEGHAYRRPTTGEQRAELLELLEGMAYFTMGAHIETNVGIRQPSEDAAHEWAEELLAAWRGRVDLVEVIDSRGDAVLEAKADAQLYGAGYLRLDQRGTITRVDPERIRLAGPTSSGPTR